MWHRIPAPAYAIVGGLALVMFVGSFLAYQDGSYNGGILTLFLQETIQGGIAAVAGYGLRQRLRYRRNEQHHAQLAFNEAIEAARTGTLPTVSPSRLIMHSGEKAFLAVPAKLLEDKAIGFVGSGGSVRVHVAKRVSVGVGGGRGHQQRDIVTVATGEFVVSDQRAAFAGDMKSFDLPLRKLTNIQGMADGLILHSGNTSKMVQIADRATAQIALTILNRVTHESPS